VLLKASSPSLPGVMLVTLLTSIGVFSALYIGFVMQRYAITILRDLKEEAASAVS
jgi:hypothetical protein